MRGDVGQCRCDSDGVGYTFDIFEIQIRACAVSSLVKAAAHEEE
jgi:hypothetical protein